MTSTRTPFRRAKPQKKEKKVVPLGQQDYPPVFWVRLRLEYACTGKPGNPKLALGFDDDGDVYVAGHGMTPINSCAMQERYAYSATRQDNDWHRCEKDVEA